ncbi:hypothetical protein KXV69_003285 [Aspergillus fumigatus]|nr:hypothetical protein KXX68_005644 [Aspergillus fumigatus]KAH1834367.1 hypothetical protein KXX43_005422 [Aspergillus fumigatus]KAH1890553.1 hypothetical protein KXW04_003698 [Aspergillus fumigatus]KAH1935539.1 hypothetical protein KXV69_003285 [Aspergillus fumigatus]KAH2811580.1 hypothetical protein KXW07_001241 [Aspergillus fumigatus]
MAHEAPLTRAMVSKFLRSYLQGITEEDKHPWDLNYSVDRHKPLLRTWDKWSGSQPSQRNIMLSRLPRQRLDSSELRKKFLATHADYKDWTPTPFISFTQLKQDLEENAVFRAAKRDSQRITVVNPNVRIENGFPILNMGIEMRHYGIPDPYNRSNEYYRDHYICLWEVTEPEVVGHWQWDDLKGNNRWYEEIIMPAFEKHNERSFALSARRETLDMSALLGALPDNSWPLIGKESPGRLSALFSEGNASSEEDEVNREEEYDSYDSYDEGEANAIDNLFKILEGDW